MLVRYIVFIISFLIGPSMVGQDLSDPIPVDPSITTGVLDNGLRYIIRNNNKPKDKAELRLVVKAGSLLETENQRGLAHFLEHMAFKGTENFKKSELKDYLEKNGVRFGADLNAYTSFDETVYKLTLPTNDSVIFDKGVEILREWSSRITLNEEDIEEERGVVIEEYRSGLVGTRRLFNKYIPLITNDSRHAKRLPIGKLDVLRNFETEDIRSFYKDWYRPNLMGVIIVGDIDVEKTEDKIKSSFGDMENPENHKIRTEYGIRENDKLQAGIFTDTEVEKTNFYAYYKKKKTVPKTLKDYKGQLVNRLYRGMLNQRMKEVIDLGQANVLGMNSGIGHFLADQDAYFVRGNLKEGFIEDGIRATLKESERARRFGFTKAELERYKMLVLNNADLRRKEEGKINSGSYVNNYIEYFIEGSPIPSSDFTYKFYKRMLPEISLDEVNKVAENWVTEKDVTLILSGPEKEELVLPEKEELIKWYFDVKNENIEPYEDSLTMSDLMKDVPIAGEVVSENYIEEIGLTELKLSNDVRVILKPTKLQNDIINLSGYRPGGSSLAPDEDYISARYAGEIINQSGVNGISSNDLKKMTMGKTVNLRTYINFYEELISGNSSKKDIETLFQLTHLYFVNPNKDKQKFETFKENEIEEYKNNELNPVRFFKNEIAKEISNNHPRAIPLTSNRIKKELDLDKAFDFYNNRFQSAKGFTLFFVGNFDIEEIKPLIKKYIASLPADEIVDKARDIGLRYKRGVNKVYYRGSEDKADVDMRYIGDFEYSVKNKKLLNALSHVLRLRLYEELRDKLGGVYGVRVTSFSNDVPYEWYRQSIEFSCSPDKVEELTRIVKNEVEKIKNNGVSQKDLLKVKKALRLEGKDGLNYNGFWSSKLKESYKENIDPKSIIDYDEFPDSLTSAVLQDLAKKHLLDENLSQFILLPKEKKN